MKLNIKFFNADGIEIKGTDAAAFFGLVVNGEVVEYYTSRKALYLAVESMECSAK
jgi:hypothetical protein